MIRCIRKIISRFSDFMLGTKNENEKIKNEEITYTITSVFPSKSIMEEAEKYL